MKRENALKPTRTFILLAAIAAAIGLGALFAPGVQASGAWRCVNPGGTSGCYSTIQAAINDSSFGDNINVWAGTYYEHIILKDGVSIYGAGWDQTIISGNYSTGFSTVMVPSTVGTSTLLSGVQVTGGGSGTPGTSSDGGGIWIGGSPTIKDTWVFSNTGYWGGGLTVWGGSPTLVNVPAWNNKALQGGGFFLGNSAVVTITSDTGLTDGTVLWNTATDSGGGFYIDSSKVTITGLRVWWNTAGNHGGGACWQNSTGSWQNNSFLSNSVTNASSLGGGVYVTGSSTKATLNGNWLEGNSALLAGGGLDLENGATALINANTIVTNTAEGGAGVSMSSAGVVTFTNNIVARNVTAMTYPSGLNIYGTAARIVNNTISDNTWLGIYFHTSNGIVIANNIVSGNGMGIYRAEGTTPAYTEDYNDVYNNSSGGNYYNVTPGAHDVSINPAFVASGNMLAYYHLQTTSPVAKTGSFSYAPPKDIDGELRVIFTSLGADQVPFTRYYLPMIRK